RESGGALSTCVRAPRGRVAAARAWPRAVPARGRSFGCPGSPGHAYNVVGRPLTALPAYAASVDSQRLRGLRARDREALAAFAEAMVPDGGGLPGAGPRGVDAAADVSRFLAQVPARQRWVVTAALRAVEWLSFPRPFSRLALDARVRRL